MSRSPLDVAVVGAGVMGRLHIRVVSESETTRLVAVVDRDPATERLAAERHVRWARSVEEILDGTPPDFAIVSVPTSEHGIARSFLDAGIPVLVEKPLAASLAEAADLISAASKTGAILGVGHVERFNPAVRALRSRLTENTLGRVFQIEARRLSPFPDRVSDAGVALDLATHDLDVMCDLVGTPVRISAETDRRAHGSREDLLAAILRFDSGVVGLLDVNWLTPTKIRQLSVTGERGMYVVDYLNQQLTLYENARADHAWETLTMFAGVTEGNVTRFAISRTEPLLAQLESFAAAVRGEAPFEVTATDGLKVLQLALAVVEAGRKGETVDFASRTGYA